MCVCVFHILPFLPSIFCVVEAIGSVARGGIACGEVHKGLIALPDVLQDENGEPDDETRCNSFISGSVLLVMLPCRWRSAEDMASSHGMGFVGAGVSIGWSHSEV